ncbi:MAG: hypothetical protein UY56_C0016G0002 [Parcubacteria group bacterium GW2011_GWA1_50_14]|uniref:Uncharacterized protein n=1 Tax=Candidatus Liptonbacteria bacterium GWB1_49_6 TaxID=1798644 RepID=A0A1G2C699_9BACT|nr:MAG: hypothetical protein UY56_C0016G0002 [Parcubacteria group bacterium GW2011_GWA1_50_14]OGY96928.1 MAG: hypothetical protein A2122_01065 [Candidatus Liptonbacteria bacterium GWB1_49_6]
MKRIAGTIAAALAGGEWISLEEGEMGPLATEIVAKMREAWDGGHKFHAAEYGKSHDVFNPGCQYDRHFRELETLADQALQRRGCPPDQREWLLISPGRHHLLGGIEGRVKRILTAAHAAGIPESD